MDNNNNNNNKMMPATPGPRTPLIVSATRLPPTPSMAVTAVDAAEKAVNEAWRAQTQDMLESIARKLEIHTGNTTNHKESVERAVGQLDSRLLRLEANMATQLEGLHGALNQALTIGHDVHAYVDNAAKSAAHAAFALLPQPPNTQDQHQHQQSGEISNNHHAAGMDAEAMLDVIQHMVTDAFSKEQRKRARDQEAMEARLQDGVTVAKLEVLESIEAMRALYMRNAAAAAALAPTPLEDSPIARNAKSSTAPMTAPHRGAGVSPRITARGGGGSKRAKTHSSSEYHAAKVMQPKKKAQQQQQPKKSKPDETARFRANIMRMWYNKK